jgi:tetratricopeptide (TPR) repeat protein
MSARVQRAALLLNQSRFDLAEQELRLALADDPDDPLAHTLLARALLGMKKLEPATEEAERAVACGPNLPYTHHALAAVRLERNHYPEAEAAVREAIRLDPTDPDCHSLAAAVCAEQEDWLGALAAADEGLAQDPEHAACLNLRAMALVHLNRRAEAAATMEGALANDPDNAFTHANRGWELLHANDPRRALEHFREALRLDPDQEFARLGMVEALKARYWAYRQVLRYFLWMSRLSPQARWGVVIGLLVLQRVIASVSRSNPRLAPVLDPLLVAYFVLVVTTWTAGPLSNLLLRLNKFGRMVLTRDERVASNWVAACLLVALAGVVVSVAGPRPYDELGQLGALAFVLLLLPLSAAFACPEGWPRRWMALYTLAMFGAIVVGLGLCASAFSLEKVDLGTAQARYDTGLTLLMANNLAAFLSGFVANWLVSVRPRL